MSNTQDLLDNTLQEIADEWSKCKQDPVNLNHLYTITGKTIIALIEINNRLKQTNK